MTTDRAARVVACLGLLASGCSFALDFGPEVLLPALDAGAAEASVVGASVDAGRDDTGRDDASADAGDCGMSSCRTDCRASEVACGARCVNLQDDNRNCGACGVSCGPGASHCCRGVCVARCE